MLDGVLRHKVLGKFDEKGKKLEALRTTSTALHWNQPMDDSGEVTQFKLKGNRIWLLWRINWKGIKKKD